MNSNSICLGESFIIILIIHHLIKFRYLRRFIPYKSDLNVIDACGHLLFIICTYCATSDQ